MRGGLKPLVAANWLPIGFLTFFLLLGTYFRVAQLGQGDFGIDELFQVFAAQGLASSGEPRLPSGELYERGIDVTRLVRWSFEQWGVNEFAARLPSAFFGVVGLFLFAAILWALGGVWVAVVGTALFAVYPEAVEQSRQLRFYTYQLIFGILAFYTGWRALERPANAEAHARRSLMIQWGWMLATIVLLLVATRVQLVSLSVAAGWGMCLILAAMADLRRLGTQVWRRSAPLQGVVVGLVALIVTLAYRPDVLFKMWSLSRSVPFWITRTEGGMNPLAYYYSLAGTYPLLLALLPLIFIIATHRRGRLGIYLTVWFAVPLLLHSFVLAFKGSRFILIPMLGLFTAAAIAALWFSEVIRNAAMERNAQPGIPRQWRRIATVIIGVVGVWAFLSLPAFHQSRKMIGGRSTRWSVAAEILRSRPDLADIPIGQSRALHVLFYWGRLDFIVGEPGLHDLGETRVDAGDDELVGRTVRVPILSTADQIVAHYAGRGAVLIGIEADMVRAGRIDNALADVVSEHGNELCQGRCGTLSLYHWRFDASRGR